MGYVTFHGCDIILFKSLITLLMADTTLFGVMWLSFKYDKVTKNSQVRL